MTHSNFSHQCHAGHNETVGGETIAPRMPPKQHAMLEMGRHGKPGKNQQEHEQIVDTQDLR